MKYQILALNAISEVGLKALPQEQYDIVQESASPDAVLLRSYDLHKHHFAMPPKAIVRAGAGVNNIPVDKMTDLGVPVFNTPGANANAVKELVFAGLLLSCRNILPAWDHTRQLDLTGDELARAVETTKKQFVGTELQGKVLGVIGLGAIGVQVANLALAFGMRVIGYDPVISVRQAWQVEAGVTQAERLDELLSQSDFVTVHVPAIPETKHMIDAKRIAVMKPGCALLNFARQSVVDSEAVGVALRDKKMYNYITDFPTEDLCDQPGVVCLPHLGASTQEAEQNCAKMAVRQLRQFLETGQIQNSVNFPEVILPWREGYRMVIVNKNVPNMVGQISTRMAEANLNVLDLLNKSREDIAITLVDVDKMISDALLADLVAIEGVISARIIA